MDDSVAFELNGVDVQIANTGDTLLGALRDQLGCLSVKDGCSPQGQCGCCTVLVDGAARVACVTPAKRVTGRRITTLDGLEPQSQTRWAEAFCVTGASQCGFCTPGIIVRLDALAAKGVEASDSDAVKQALLAHLCRCTGWQTIIEAWELYVDGAAIDSAGRDFEAAAQRAQLEGRVPQQVSPQVVLGSAGFAADTAPDEALIAVRTQGGEWVVAESLVEARKIAGKVQGRRTTVEHGWPLEMPEGDWAKTLRTTWVEPAYLETDASWSEPSAEPYSPLANGGAFGAKLNSPVNEVARRLAAEHDRAVLVLASREDVTQLGPKRPPLAAGIRADGTGIVRVVATPGIVERIQAVAPGLVVEEVEVLGPKTSADLRGSGWVEATMLKASLAQIDRNVTTLATETVDSGWISSPDGAVARARVSTVEGQTCLSLTVKCGEVLDSIVLRSYCIGAAHMAWSWLHSEALTVDSQGVIQDLTVRSFGVLRAVDMPQVEVEIVAEDREPVNGSDAVFAAVCVAAWLSSSCAQDLPIALES